jgi:hypothetical protein
MPKFGMPLGKLSKKAGELLRIPVTREIIAAGLATTVATTLAKRSARRAAREEVARAGGIDSPGAVLGSAVATVASEAVKGLISPPAKRKSSEGTANRGRANVRGKSKAKKQKSRRIGTASGSKRKTSPSARGKARSARDK